MVWRTLEEREEGAYPTLIGGNDPVNEHISLVRQAFEIESINIREASSHHPISVCAPG